MVAGSHSSSGREAQVLRSLAAPTVTDGGEGAQGEKRESLGGEVLRGNQKRGVCVGGGGMGEVVWLDDVVEAVIAHI